MSRPLGVAVIGMGWMGSVHARCYRLVPQRFPEFDIEPRLVVCADNVEARAQEGVTRAGFERATTDWREAVADPDVAFETVLEDAHLVVVDKPAGLVVHPGAGHDRGTLVNGLLARYPEIAGVGDAYRPGIVHRLDRGTSGLMVVARTERAYRLLVEQLRAHRPQRVYCALVREQPEAASGVIDAPIGRSSRNPQRMTVTDRGREARTGYTVERRYSAPARAALLSCRLETGRTHQIRVHLRAIGHPVVGDPTYGSGRADDVFGLSRPFLHARSLSFTHPASGETVQAESPLPADLAAVLAACA